jgi:hypothetical protein
MTRVEELVPGMKVNMPNGEQATFIIRTTHPIWQHLQLVVWRMPDDWSHDALEARQDVGTVVPSTSYEREVNLRDAFLGTRDQS